MALTGSQARAVAFEARARKAWADPATSDWRRRRLAVGATLDEVAAAAGVHRNTVRGVELGEGNPSDTVRFKIARALRQLAERGTP